MAGRFTFSPDTLIRFRAGRMLIHTTTSKLPAFETDSAMLIGWLCQFATPALPEALLSSMAPEARPDAAHVLGYLQRSGVLIPVDPSHASAPDPTTEEAKLRSHLRLLARSFYEVACDLMAFGPFAEVEMVKRTGIGVERRLMALLAATDGIRSQLAELRTPFIAPQLAKLGLEASTRDIKLHIGCGKGLLDGWVNLDIYPAPLSTNVLWGLPFPDGTVQCVFVSHLLEHLFFPRDVRPFLAEVRRVLTPGGVVRVVVPDLETCIEAYVSRNAEFFASRRETWSWWPANPTRLEDFLAYAGAGAEPAYLFESHKFGYDFETLEKTLFDAGFTGVVRSEYMQSEHESLRVDDVSAVAKAKYGDKYYSLFVEAYAPN